MLGFQPGQFISSLNITYQVSSVHNFHRCCAMHAGSIAFELQCDNNYMTRTETLYSIIATEYSEKICI